MHNVYAEMVVKKYYHDVKQWWVVKARERFLKKNGCSSEEEYSRRFDPDINSREDNIARFYRGYPYVFVFTDPLGDIWTKHGDWLQGLRVIREWCDENIAHKYRHDIHRAMRSHWEGWTMNELATDYVFFAFKDEKDYLWFSMKWSGT